MAKTNSGLVAYAKAQVGLPYWYGAYGQTASASLYTANKNQYPSWYTETDYASQYGKKVHDCSGLVKGYLWCDSNTGSPTYNSSQDKNAKSIYAAAATKGSIGSFPKTNGLLVFRGASASAISHVGVYADGYVYEAKNHSDGVCKTVYQKSDWNFWAQCPYCTDDTITSSTSSTTTTKAAATTTAQPKAVWDYLYSKIGNAYGVAGLMGNLKAESGLVANNLQNTSNTKLGLTDSQYTEQVDNGTYTNFVKDSAGYGIAQWTYWSRKQALKEYADEQNASIGNLTMQLGYLYKELSNNYTTVLNTLKNATSVLEASNAVLLKFEQPADTSTTVQSTRAGYGQTYYDTYAGTSSSSSSSTSSSSGSSSGNTTYSGTGIGTAVANVAMHIRNAANQSGTSYGTISKGTAVEVLEILTSGWYKIVWPGASCGYAYTSNANGNYYTYTANATSSSTASIQTDTITTLQDAPSQDKNYKGGKKYKTTTALNLRYGPSSEKLTNGKYKYGIIATLAKNTSVMWYGYYSTESGTKWLYVTANGKTGWVSSSYLTEA